MSENVSIADSVYNSAAALFGGSVSESEAARLLAMCTAAASELESRLREGVEPAQIQELFVSAAGVLALAMYMQLSDGMETASSVKVGNVSMSKRGSGSMRSSASTLRKQAETMLSGYLADRGFDFKAVRG